MSSKYCHLIAFLSILECNGFCNTISTPTRISLQSSTIIDLFIINMETECVLARTAVGYISYRVLVVAFIDIIHHQLKHARSASLFQCITPTTLETFRGDIKRFNWSIIEKESCINSAYLTFVKHFTTIYFKNVPLNQLPKCRKARKPEITQDFLRKINILNKVFKRFINAETLKCWNTF